MFKTLIAIVLIILMSSIASAEQLEDWPFGQRNVIPNDIEGVMYDFEEGSNCGEFNNQYPNITTFLTVDGGNVPRGYGPCYPSYNTVGGSMCGTTRCYMNIYPYDNQQDWIMVVNGRAGFAPKTCCESDPSICWTGNCYPGPCADVEFKEGTRYISFLASTDGTLRVLLYDKKGSILKFEQIGSNTDRIHPKPSNFTRFEFYSQDTDIASMELTGPFNGWMLDDLIIGGAPGYLPEPEPTPDQPTDYSWAAERISLLDGALFNPIGLGYDLVMGEFYTADEIINGQPMNWDPLNKELSYSPGISDVGAIIWALNENENIVNNLGIDDMADKDFKEWIAYGDHQPGDVAFIDYEADGYYDEVIMFIEPQIDPDTGATEDCIRFLEEDGVHFVDSKYLHALYGIDNGVGVQSFMDVKRLPDSPKGNKSPYPKVPGKFKI